MQSVQPAPGSSGNDLGPHIYIKWEEFIAELGHLTLQLVLDDGVVLVADDEAHDGVVEALGSCQPGAPDGLPPLAILAVNALCSTLQEPAR